MKNKKITDAEIQKALKKFKRKGGLIRRLPDQVVPSRKIAAGRDIYENVEDFVTKVNH